MQTKGKRGRRADEIEEYIKKAHTAHKLARAEMRYACHLITRLMVISMNKKDLSDDTTLIVVCRRESAESSDDEEHFQRKEEKRLARDKARLNPMILSEPHKVAQ